MNREDLIKIAKNAMKNAYAPVTGYKVGAALLAKSGTVYIGCNVEEYSILALSNCAERVAIQNAISCGEKEFVAIAIVGGKDTEKIDDTLIPCGTCLQYILDMCKDVDIISYIDGKLTTNKVTYFLNAPFELNTKI